MRWRWWQPRQSENMEIVWEEKVQANPPRVDIELLAVIDEMIRESILDKRTLVYEEWANAWLQGTNRTTLSALQMERFTSGQPHQAAMAARRYAEWEESPVSQDDDLERLRAAIALPQSFIPAMQPTSPMTERWSYRTYPDRFLTDNPPPSRDDKKLNLVHIKANSLLEAVCQKLGFRHLVLSSGTIWIKKRGKDTVMIDSAGEVYMGQARRCVQIEGYKGLQLADVVASKMIALATNARNDISTLTMLDREMLATLFANVSKDVSLAALASEVENDLREALDEADNNSADS